MDDDDQMTFLRNKLLLMSRRNILYDNIQTELKFLNEEIEEAFNKILKLNSQDNSDNSE